jgi:peptidoglycan/xylan/chitin deacetylase (PgdA/CDA1 family)
MAPCTIPADRLDRLIELLCASRPSAASSWLTVTFDDGYDDAASYVASRAPRYPNVEFIFFVCAEKTARGAGFRWDAADEAVQSGHNPGGGESALDVLLENEREELRGLGRRQPYRLADIETVRALGRLPNVAIGNHTNGHLRPMSLTDEQARIEYSRSSEEFGRLFGHTNHFAFPYGTPGVDFEPRHARIVGALGVSSIWSTEGRPYDRAERRHGAVLPRFPVDGTMDPRQIATQIAARSLMFRLRGRRSIPR